MAKFSLGELVLIRKEWTNSPNERNLVYRVVNVNETTNRYYIECINTGLRLAPQELVSEEMIEKA